MEEIVKAAVFLHDVDDVGDLTGPGRAKRAQGRTVLHVGQGRLRAGASSKRVGYTEASRGCKHLCRHCPVVPIYQGAFRVVQPEVVVALGSTAADCRVRPPVDLRGARADL